MSQSTNKFHEPILGQFMNFANYSSLIYHLQGSIRVDAIEREKNEIIEMGKQYIDEIILAIIWK